MQKYGWVGFSLCLLMGGGQRNAVHLESTTWSLNSVSMKSVQRSAWMLPKEASVRQTVSNMQETLIAAYGVTVRLNARRSHCGENVLLSARSLQEMFIK